MKKHVMFRWLIVVSLLFSMFAPVIQAQDILTEEVLFNEEKPNLLFNGSFEEPVASNGQIPGWSTWIPRGDAAVSVEHGDAQAGNYAGYITATEPSSLGAFGQEVPVEEGKTYSLSFWAKSKDIDLELASGLCTCVRIQFYDENRVHTQSIGHFGNLSSTQEWTLFHFNVTAPANTESFLIQPLLYRGTGELWFDDIRLTEVDVNQPADFLHYDASVEKTGVVNVEWATDHVPEAQPLFNVYRSTESGFTPDDDTLIGSTTDNVYRDRAVVSEQTYYYRIAFLAPGGEFIVTEEMEAEIPFLESGSPNMIFNGSFEEPVASNGQIPGWSTWIPRGDAVVSIVYGEAQAGDYSGYITATEPSSLGAFGQDVPVEEGKTYSLSYWAKSKDVELDSDLCTCVRIQFYDENRAHTQSIGHFGNLSSTQEWTFFHYMITAPANTETFLIQPMLYRGKGELWFDDIRIMEADPNQPVDFVYDDASVKETGVVELKWATNHLPDTQPLFNVYRSTTSEFTPGDDTWIGSTEENEYVDRSISAGQTYYYKISFTNPDDEEDVTSNEVEVNIPDELPAVQPVSSFEVMDTKEGTTGLYWELMSSQRADTVNIYGGHNPLTEENKTDAILLASISAASGKYVIDSELQPDLIKPYYAVSVVDGDGNESALVSGEFLSRIFIERVGDGFAVMNFSDAILHNGEISELKNASGESLRVLTAGGITYVPWHLFDEYFGAEVTVINDSVEVQYDQTTAVFILGESTFTVNGQTHEIPAPPFTNNDTIYLPVIPLAEALGKTARSIAQLTIVAEQENLDAMETDIRLVETGIQLLSSQPINREDITDEDFHELKQKAREYLVGSENNDLSNEWIAEHIGQITSFGQGSWNQMNKDEHAVILFGNAFPTTSAEMTSQYNNLSRMAVAYGTPGSDLYQNEALKEDILYGLEWLYDHLYGLDLMEGNSWRNIYEFNWWDWMVGVPSHMNNILLIMEPEMEQTEIEKYLAPYLYILEVMQSGTVNSRNYFSTQAAILLHDVDMMISLLDDYDIILAPGSDETTLGEDWSYNHQGYPQSGNYGVASLLDRATVGYSLLSGTKFEVRSPYKYNMAMWMYYMFEPIMYKGGNMIMYGGRSFSGGSNEQNAGAQVIAAMLDLIGAYGLDDDERLKKMIKRHVTDENIQDILRFLNINQLTKLQQVLEDNSVEPDHYEMAYVYYTGDRVVQHRDGYAFGIAMSSSRMPTYSSINQANHKGWYTGDGMTYLYLDHDLYQFGGDYRTNVNPYHLPGVTNDTQPRAELSLRQSYFPDQDFVGAVQLKNKYFTAAMAYESFHNDVPPTGGYEDGGGMLPLHDSSLVAKKAWFAFDEEIVALGTGISAEDGFEVATTVDNRRLIEVRERFPDSEEDTIPYHIENVTAVGSDGNLPINVIDGDYGSRWSYQGLDNAWIQLELAESLPIGYLGISVYNGQNSAALFDIRVSNDGENWTKVYEGATSGTTPELEAFQLEEVVEAKYVRLYGYGRTTGSMWNSYTEIQVYPPDDQMPLELKNMLPFETGAEEIIADGQLLEFEDDSLMALTDAEWVALENNAGYYFPNGGDLTVAKVGNATKFMELRLHHGVNPDGEEYAYVLLPHKNELETADYAANPDITILANTEQVQAVQDRSTGTTGIVFWEAGTFGDITVSEPMIVMVQEQDSDFELSVSDPTQKLNNASITIDRSLETVNSDRVLSIETGSQTVIEIDFSDSKGKTYAASFYDPSFEMTTELIQELVESYADAGAFENEQAERALSMHLTAVRVFEQQADAAKVVQHMEGFLVLLNHQQEEGLISKKAYDDLKRKTGALMKMWK